MQFAARPYAAVTAALVAGGFVAAAAPIAATQAGVAVHDIRLANSGAGFLADMATQQLSGGSSLIDGLLDFNGKIATFDDDLLGNLFSGQTSSFANGIREGLEQLFDGTNGWLGIGENALLGLLGANGTVSSTGVFTATDLSDFNKSLFLDQDHNGSYPFGGLESVLGHYLGSTSFIGATLFGMSGADLEGSFATTVFQWLVGEIAKFNTALVESELAFNHNLVTLELGIEKALFGDDSALNGVLNRAFNTFNMLFDAPEKMLNGIIGATGYDVDYAKVLELVAADKHADISSAMHLIASPQDLTASLLTGSGEQVFNGGEIGGLTGMFDQNMAMWGDVLGLQGSDFDGLLNHVDLGALGGSVLGFFGGLWNVITPFGALFGL